jgi:hypothetical protein
MDGLSLTKKKKANYPETIPQVCFKEGGVKVG